MNYSVNYFILTRLLLFFSGNNKSYTEKTVGHSSRFSSRLRREHIIVLCDKLLFCSKNSNIPLHQLGLRSRHIIISSTFWLGLNEFLCRQAFCSHVTDTVELTIRGIHCLTVKPQTELMKIELNPYIRVGKRLYFIHMEWLTLTIGGRNTNIGVHGPCSR